MLPYDIQLYQLNFLQKLCIEYNFIKGQICVNVSQGITRYSLQVHTSRHTATASTVTVAMRFNRTNKKQLDVFHLKLFIIYAQNKIPS
jgi:hypothetical protein